MKLPALMMQSFFLPRRDDERDHEAREAAADFYTELERARQEVRSAHPGDVFQSITCGEGPPGRIYTVVTAPHAGNILGRLAQIPGIIATRVRSLTLNTADQAIVEQIHELLQTVMADKGLVFRLANRMETLDEEVPNPETGHRRTLC